MLKFLLFTCFIWSGLLLSSCKPQPERVPAKHLQVVELQVPAGFPEPTVIENNPLTAEGIALGRKLFYDTRLSGNNRLSCASCHKQELAFTDAVALSQTGATGKPLLRHSPGLTNVAWMDGLFWEGGAKNLESQAFGPLTHKDEMGQNLNELVQELKEVPLYVEAFRQVFNDEIKATYIGRALAQFQRTLVSAGSRYDKYVRQEPGGTMSSLELQGLALVRQKCGSCHAGELFTDNQYHNNGLDTDFSNIDYEGIYQGRYRITEDKADIGKFKTPTLRNVTRTAPYMHDGRFATLEEVLQHYSQHLQVSPTTAAVLLPAGIPLTAAEKEAILAFLETLTDHEFLQNQKFASPF